LIEQTPFLLFGSLEQIVDKLERLRDDVGISHVVVRDAEGSLPSWPRWPVADPCWRLGSCRAGKWAT
jgi:hypothetical protein